ncbi:MAG TPA: tetratricopeptide repeat protein [Oligoflexus sp.]|uniref:tetratricopeptide repeat protein n=1 Tax=Oligoflexus sp. TaxID=1971216 RepID=UPI002D80E9AD|nr:tetratricopeptide repeat protein [Oligoflexus sp.]HET9241552.1 tetratricopeptide repeat protein [Oligoflexus sp.]
MKLNSITKTLALPILALALASGGMDGYAAPKKEKAKLAKDAAPAKGDMNDYFAESRQGVSPEKLREADALRMQTVASIHKLLATPNMQANRKFELYLRLGELHSERAEYIRDMEMKDYETKYEAWKKTKKGAEPQLTTKSSQAELLKSTEAFRKLVKEFPKHPRTDAALYSLAKTLLLLENDNAVLYFNQLVNQHKDSMLLADTYLALGEFYFYKHDMEKAKDNYKNAMEASKGKPDKEAKVYPFAVYKLGWAYYNSKVKSDKETMENVDKGIAAFKLAIKIAEKDKDSPGNFNLRQEAINDLIMVYAETEKIDEAMEYFNRIGEKESFYDMLERLGNIYEDNGENTKAIDVFGRLLAESPTRPRNPEIHAKLAKLYDTTLNAAALVDNMKRMKALYVDAGSKWIAANATKKDVLDEAVEKTRKNIHRYGTLYHQQGQKLKKKPMLATAAELYKLYLATFPKTEDAYELRYYLADIYFQFEQFENAADEYYTVTQERPKDGKYLKESAFNAVVAIKKIDEATTYQKLPPLGQVSKPIPLPRVKQKMVTMIDNYAALLPKEKEGFPMRYTAAMTWFEYGHYPEGLKRFESIGMDIPDTTQGKSAIKMILTFYAERKDWENLVRYSKKYYDNKAIVATSLKDDLIKAMKTGVFSLGLQQNKENKLAEAAKTFESFQSQFPQDESADAALYNASTAYYKLAKVEDALRVGHLLLKEYPKSKLAPKVSLDMAQTNESLADFDQAAKLYKYYGLNFSKEADSVKALYNAATLYRGLKDYPESINLYKKFISLHGKDNLARTAVLQIAEMNELNKTWGEATQYYNQYAGLWPDRSEQNLVARARLAKIALVSGNRANGLKEIRRLQKDLTTKDAPPALEARRIAAAALIDDIENDYKNFTEIRVTDAARIEKEMASKQERLVGLVARYQEVIELGSGEHTVSSLYHLGVMHENFAKVLFDAPAPKGANQKAIDDYRSSIEKVAFPLRDESNKFFEAAFKRSQEVQTFTEWTRKAYEKMVELQPDKYPAVVEKTTSPTYMSHVMVWDESVADLAN